MATVSFILDLVLIVAAIWMVVVARGIGGVVGRTLSYITIGAVITGLAHLLATLTGTGPLGLDIWGSLGISISGFNGFAHRVIVLSGFIVLLFGFQQLRAIRR